MLLAATMLGLVDLPTAKKLFGVFGTPTVGLAGAATGFYYASKG